MAADVLSGHFAIAGGRFIAAIKNVVDDDCDLCRWNFIRNSETWCREKSIDNNAALCRWAFAKWGTRFNKCDRNPVIDQPLHYFSCMYIQSRKYSHYTQKKDPQPWKVESVQSVSSGMLSTGKLLSNRVTMILFKSTIIGLSTYHTTPRLLVV